MRLLIATFNAGQTSSRRDDFEPWLNPRKDGKALERPDIVAVGIQESAALPYTLAGVSGSVQSHLKRAIRATLSRQESFECVSSSRIGGILLFVFIRTAVLAEYTASTETDHVGCGPAGMSNKGAVATRLTLIGGNDGQSETFTFVTAHLAAHAHNTARRNQDWRSIVSRVRFSQGETIYDSSHLFVFGDLNYRLLPSAAALYSDHTLFSYSSENKRPIRAIKHDELIHEMQGGYTMHHLQEGTINFKPTYKFEVGQTATYSKQTSKKAWCDRILYTSSSDITVEAYQSVMAFVSSDHKPVSAVFEISARKSQTLNLTAPYRADPQRIPKRIVGRVADRFVGIPWSIIRFIGFGSDLIGLIILLLVFFILRLFSSHFWI